jgi:putative membrane protein
LEVNAMMNSQCASFALAVGLMAVGPTLWAQTGTGRNGSTMQCDVEPQKSKTPSAADAGTASTPLTITQRDQRYFKELMRAKQTEILASRMAEARASNLAVKQLAQYRVDDYPTAAGKLNGLARKKQMMLPMEPTDEQQKMLEKLNALSGPEFDHIYVSEASVRAHAHTLNLLKNIQKNGRDEDLRQLAEELQPYVEAHLEMARKVAVSNRLMVANETKAR